MSSGIVVAARRLIGSTPHVNFFYMAEVQFPKDPPEQEQEPAVIVPPDPAPVSVMNHDLPAPQDGELQAIRHYCSFFLPCYSFLYVSLIYCMKLYRYILDILIFKADACLACLERVVNAIVAGHINLASSHCEVYNIFV